MVVGTDNYHAFIARHADFLYSVFSSGTFYLYFILKEQQ